jgi:hypothetical protein
MCCCFGLLVCSRLQALPRKVACPFGGVGRGQAGNLTLPSGMVLPVIAVHSPNGASSRGG